MALQDPQTVTVDAVPYACARVQSDGAKSVYATADGNFKVTVSHLANKGRTRRMARIDKRLVAADPLTSEQEYKTLGVYLVIDEPDFGFADDAIDDIVQGMKSWLTTALITSMLGSQH